ncbi:MAG: glycosyltransferase, partial [Solirubrobacterales bacterium]|nr:glycosyltransferase [Solirubrobacterales bacterium]
MTPRTTSRVDLHVHSTASQLSKLGVQRALGLPECATPPEEVYALAKRRGMDFVTITDHDTIDGALELTDRYDDAFVSVELTCAFRAEPQHVHVLCWGIDPDQFARLRERSGDVEAVAEELGEQDIACALAHPFYAVEAPLLPRHRRRLARLFPVWETRNGSRARELNAPAAVYIETHGGTGVAGSDDHAGVDIGRTYTETPLASDWRSFLDWVRDGQATARGDQGSAAKWAHSAMALAARVYGGAGDGSDTAPEPAAVLSMVERVMREGDARSGAIGADLGPDDARALLRAWLSAVELDLDERELLDMFQDESFHHAALFRRARRCHERKLSGAVDAALAAATQGGAALPGAPMPEAAPRLAQAPMPEAAPRLAQAASALFDACVAAIPYAPAAAFLGREKAKLVTRDGEPVRVALVADAVGGMHGVTHTLDELRERGVPGFDVEVVGTDHNVDRRLSAVAEVDIPFYSGLKVGVPSLPAVVEALAEGRYDLVHLCSPGPAGVAAGLVARIMDLPVIGSYHTELAVYTGLRTADPMMEAAARAAIAAFYGQCATVLSPSPSSDAVLESMGIASERVGRWDRGVDVGRFSPALHDPAWLPACASRGAASGIGACASRGAASGIGACASRGAASGIGSEVSVLYVGRLTREKGADLLADAFLAARERDPRLHLVLAGGGPEEEALRERLGEHATFLGWLEGDALARAYASADLFLFASRTDTFGQVLLEAQASGTPVIAVAEGGPTSIVEDGVTGRLCPADVDALAGAVVELAGDEA